MSSIEVAADGAIIDGHLTGELWTCTGQLSEAQQQQIADAFNQAGILAQGDLGDECVDGLEYDVEVVVQSGPDAGYTHSFHIGQCAKPGQAISDAVAAALSPLDEATCDGCPTLIEPSRRL